MTTNTLLRPVKAHPRVIDDVLALADRDWVAGVHEAWRIGLITAAHLHWAFEHGADLVARLAEGRPTTFAIHARPAEEGVR